MKISVVCLKQECDSDTFVLETVIGEFDNTVHAKCQKCGKVGLELEIERYKKAASICPKCHSKEYIVKRDNETYEEFIYCKKCKSEFVLIDVDENGKKITKDKLKIIQLEERIENLEYIVSKLRTKIEYDIEEEIYKLDNKVSKLEYSIKGL